MSTSISVNFFECFEQCVASPVRRFNKPDKLDEVERVEGVGGWIVDWHGHSVKITRGYDLKPYLISKPDVTMIDRTEEDNFLIQASDRLWDVMSDDVECKVVQNCLTGLTAKKHPEGISEHSAETAAALLPKGKPG